MNFLVNVIGTSERLGSCEADRFSSEFTTRMQHIIKLTLFCLFTQLLCWWQ